MPKTLSDLIGPIGKQDRFQSFHTLLYSIGDKMKTLNVLIFIGHLLFGLQLNFMYLFNSSKLSWKSNKVHDTVLYILNCVFCFTPGITTTTHLDYLVISLLVFVVTYLIIISTLFIFLKYSTDYQLDNVYPLGICIVGLHVLLVPACYSGVTYAFSNEFTSHYGMFILSIFVILCSYVSTYIEYFVQYGIPKKDSIYNSKTIIFRFSYSIILLTIPIFNFYITNRIAILVINLIMLILSIVYITQQFRLSSPRMLMSYTLSCIVFSLLNLIILIFDLDGETYVSIYIIAFNIGFLLSLLISYFTKEYNLLPFREVIQTHDFSKFDKHSMFTLENIMTAASSQIDIPNEILDYLALRNPSSFVF
ncbi:hypothetical protein TVAGG3_0475670, partial [Trichomonas vaginalis G3]|uniref:hypothetical protein n=1 Tax=Trichomonas vaginalis (strain ATCC PRA-98 / G3) TaxID=412133 RepID=UPI0021E5E50B